jgi:hypothetical protein
MNNEPIEELIYKNQVIKIYNDDNPENPRQWDNLGTIFYAHNHYELGDINLEKEGYFTNWQNVQEYLIKTYKPEVILPLYLYDHSGLRLKIGSFQGLLPQGHAEFDSGQIGYILVGKKKMKEEKLTKEKAEEYLRQEIETFDDYLSGNVYGYVAETKNGEQIGSCWGYYGSTEEPIKEAKSEIDYYLERKRKEKQNKVKTLIKNKVNLIKREEILV